VCPRFQYSNCSERSNDAAQRPQGPLRALLASARRLSRWRELSRGEKIGIVSIGIGLPSLAIILVGLIHGL
jgi:uridine phosphorylase